MAQVQAAAALKALADCTVQTPAAAQALTCVQARAHGPAAPRAAA